MSSPTERAEASVNINRAEARLEIAQAEPNVPKIQFMIYCETKNN